MSSLHHDSLASILRRAYSGEMTAALAYRGHWLSLRKEREIAEIRQIEREEWVHRRAIGRMLAKLGAKPSWWLELRMAILGTIILIGCNMVGWFIPMYFAGRLESQNDREYEDAALLCESLGLSAMRDELKTMAQLERDHEQYFLEKISGHPALPFWQRLFGWGPSAISTEEEKS
jgi:demethoxyubiquinone hydroxylase (CLK1/Coq7/Cat5 family)